MELIRRLVRAVAGGLFWLHAIFLLQITPPSVAVIAERLHLQSAEMVLLLLIGCLSFLGAYGWRKVAVDLAYIYFFPFIVIYRLASGIVTLLMRRRDQATPMAVGDRKSTRKATRGSPASAATVTRPFARFSLLWGVLLVVASWRVLVWISLGVVSIHLACAIWWCVRRLWSWHGWLTDVEKQISDQVDAVVAKIMAVGSRVDDGDLRRAVQTLAFLHAAVNLLNDRRRATQILFALSTLVVITGHVYLACLFSFVYHGLARVHSIEYPWGEAFVTALFIPLLIGNLPSNVWILALGGIQATLVIGGGVAATFGYIERRVDSLNTTMKDLQRRLSDPALERRFKTLNERFKSTGTGPSSYANP